MDSLTLKNIRLFGHCGVSPEEREVGAQFEMDAEVFWNDSAHGFHGNERPAIDYTKLYEHIRKTFQGKRYKLVEDAADEIASSTLMAFDSISEIRVHFRKRPPFEASLEYVEAKVVRRR